MIKHPLSDNIGLNNIPFELVIALNLTSIPPEDFNKSSSTYVNLTEEVRKALFVEMNKTVERLFEVIIKDLRKFELIIGLGVGVPLFFIIVGVIVFIVYMKIKSRKADTDSDDE
nr:hypothetical protein BaRGS_017169 [Batillaria attramentaria]